MQTDNNASFFDATPIDSKFRKHINANYSQEFFMKKKTLSKGRPQTNEEGECFNDDKENLPVDNGGAFMSPFGLVSPMDNQTRTRNSNIMKDCCGASEFIMGSEMA
jgi:hypothetical protein